MPSPREKIAAFDAQSPERIARVAAAIEDIAPDAAAVLRQCQVDGSCDHPDFPPCAICDHNAVAETARWREAFAAYVGTAPWVMKVAVPRHWWRPPGDLGQVRPGHFLGQVKQRLRRGGVTQALIALDLGLSSLRSVDGGERRFWVPHANILVPVADRPKVDSALASLCPSGPEVLNPIGNRYVDDPWVAANYAIKLDLSSVRVRWQVEDEHGSFPLIQSRAWPDQRTLAHAEFLEFVNWRSGFAMKAIVALHRLRLSGNILVSTRRKVDQAQKSVIDVGI